jgi:hypothetical protein
VEPEQISQQAQHLDDLSGPQRAFLPHVCAVVREALHIGTLYRPDCCIAAAAILIDVLDYFRLTAKPLSVIATVFNPQMTERIEREGVPTREEAERDWFPRGCWALAVGTGDPEPGKWPGHLVATLGERVLLDLTLDQADRPRRGIALPMPLVVPFPAAFLAGDGEISGIVNGCRVVYQARPDDRTFENSRDWVVKKRRSTVVGAAIRRLKEGL